MPSSLTVTIRVQIKRRWTFRIMMGTTSILFDYVWCLILSQKLNEKMTGLTREGEIVVRE